MIVVATFILLCLLAILPLAVSFSSPIFMFLLIWPLSLVAMLLGISNNDVFNFVFTSWVLFLSGLMAGTFVARYFSKGPAALNECSKSLSAFGGYRWINFQHLPSILKIILIINLLLRIAQALMGDMDVSDFQGMVDFSVSKGNRILYVASGVIGMAHDIFFMLAAWRKKEFPRASKRKLLLYGLIYPVSLSTIEGVTIAMKIGTPDYINKAFMPVVNGLMVWYVRDFIISYNIFRKRVPIIASLLIISSASIVALYDDAWNVLSTKIISRSDFYYVFDREILDDLVTEYSFNILYWFHPFLKLFGSVAYQVPMGSFVSAKLNGFELVSVIGGPNVHLPIVLGIIFYQAPCYISSLLIIFLSFGLGYSVYRNNIIWKTSVYVSPLVVFSIFLFIRFPLLIVEPSAWGHELFFAFILITIIRVVRIKKPIALRGLSL